MNPEQLALLLERNLGHLLTPVLLKYLVTTLRGRPALPPGRKNGISARIDFMMADAICLYDKKLRQFRAEDRAERARVRGQRVILPKAREPAHERAAKLVLTVMKAKFGQAISLKRFFNLMSQISNRSIPEEDRVDPGDGSEEFTTPKRKRRRRR